jgi:Flp pilus assembly protein CpaB
MTQPAKERTHAVELEYSSQNSRRSKIYIGVGIVVALLVAATVYIALQASGLTEGAEVEMRTVVVAVNEIGSRQPIAEADITTREVAADPTNANAFESVDQAVGRVTGVAIAAGELVSPTLLASTTEGMTYSILEPGEDYDPAGPDLRAISMTVGASNAVAGTLVPGQNVDLLVTMPINPLAGQDAQAVDPAAPVEFLAGPSTKVTLQSLWILARDGDVYILRTDLATSEKITELTAAGGTFTMVLRPDQDDRIAETEGSTIDRLVEEYGFPVPRMPQFEELQSAGN